MRDSKAEEYPAPGLNKSVARAVIPAHHPPCPEPKADKQGENRKDERDKEILRHLLQGFEGVKQKNPKPERKSRVDSIDQNRKGEAGGSRSVAGTNRKSLQQSAAE